MIYADFNYYKDFFYGKAIPNQESFDSAAVEAGAYLDRFTFGKTIRDMEPVKNAFCAVAEVVYRQTEAENTGVVSGESVGNHSVSYAVSAKSSRDWAEEKARCLRLYLANTGVLYGGLR